MDKLSKVRADIERLIEQTKPYLGACAGQVVAENNSKIAAYNDVLCILDSMQKEPKECMYSKDNYTNEDRKVLCEGCEEECKFNKKEEPVRIKKGCKYRCLSDMQNIDTGAVSFFKDKIYSAPEDNTLVSEENRWLCDLSENSSNFELVDDPLSEDFEEAARRYAALQAGMKDAMTSEYYEEYPYSKNDIKAFKAGANWQKQQDNKDANHAWVEQIKTEQMWYEKGMADMKQQMMAKAVDATVHIDAGGYPYIPQMELYDYDKDIPLAKEGDKYKVILIKED